MASERTTTRKASRFRNSVWAGLGPRLLSRLPILLLAGLTLHNPAARGTEGRQSLASDVAFRPLRGKDGYVQAWNVSFRGSGHYVIITYVVSNIGPGSLNNGASLFVTNGTETKTLTAEFAEAHLKARPAELNMSFGTDNSLSYERGRYIATAKIDDTTVRLELTPGGAGVRFSGGSFPVRGDGGAFIQVDVPVMYAGASGTLTIGKNTVPLRGVAGIEHILSNESPHGYAKQFELTRTFSYAQGLAVGGLHGAKGQPDEFRAALTLGGRVTFLRKAERREIKGEGADGLSGYRLPTTVVYHLMGPGKCAATVQRHGFIGGFDILSKVSTVLRWVLRTFFAKPYILHYRSTVSLQCADPEAAGIPKEGVSLPADTSYYPINP